MTIHEQLQRIALEHPHLLRAYQNDLLQHDRDTCLRMTPGDRFVWILREHGTEMFDVGVGMDPIWVTYHLNRPDENPTRCFLITATAAAGAAGTVVPISYDEARRLAHEGYPEKRSA